MMFVASGPQQAFAADLLGFGGGAHPSLSRTILCVDKKALVSGVRSGPDVDSIFDLFLMYCCLFCGVESKPFWLNARCGVTRGRRGIAFLQTHPFASASIGRALSWENPVSIPAPAPALPPPVRGFPFRPSGAAGSHLLPPPACGRVPFLPSSPSLSILPSFLPPSPCAGQPFVHVPPLLQCFLVQGGWSSFAAAIYSRDIFGPLAALISSVASQV